MRVFNTLLLQGQLEPKQIGDFIMREHKEARELLYRMFKAGYLQMQVWVWCGAVNSLCSASGARWAAIMWRPVLCCAVLCCAVLS
jgi:hypothetical protein